MIKVKNTNKLHAARSRNGKIGHLSQYIYKVEAIISRAEIASKLLPDGHPFKNVENVVSTEEREKLAKARARVAELRVEGIRQ